MKHILPLALALGFSTTASAEVYNIPGSALTLKQMSDNFMTGSNFRSEYSAPVNYTGVGKVCAVTLVSAKNYKERKINLSLFKHSATKGSSIDAQPTLMASVKSHNGAANRKVQIETEREISSPDVDSSKDFLFVVAYNAYSTKVMGVTVEILPECPPN